MNGSVTNVAFTPNSRHLLSTGSDGQVYVWVYMWPHSGMFNIHVVTVSLVIAV